MSTLRVSTIQNASSSTANITLDTSGNATVGGTLAMGSSFLRNRIINGDMRIDQRNSGAAVTINTTANTYTLDRWVAAGQSADGVFTVDQTTDAPAGFNNSALLTVTTADASIGATQVYLFGQFIEGFNTGDFGFGSASAKTVTVSFWAKSTGLSYPATLGAVIQNSANDRTYPFTYVISASNTWQYITVTIPGDTTGTWLTDSGRGISLRFQIGAGSSSSAAAGSWTGTSNIFGVTGATNIIGTLNATLSLTGVQFEVGSVATPFERRQYGQELALCQRYYFRSTSNATTPFTTFLLGVGASSTTAFYCSMVLPTTMRATPTISASNCRVADSASAYTISSISANRSSATNISVNITMGSSSGSGFLAVQADNNAAAYVDAAAEL